MPLPLLLAGASVAGPILGGVMGSLFGGGDRDRANQLMEEAMAEINSVGAPPDLSREIILQKFSQAGLYTPQLEQAIDLGISKVSQINENPELAKAQMGALESLSTRGKTGLTAEDRAALNQVRSEVQRDSQAKQGQILQQMQARGLGGSGAELLAQLSSAQAGDDRASMEGDNIAAQASRNALEAMVQGGQLAGNIRGQDFDVNRTRAAAEDEVNRFNVQNAIGRQTRNVGMGNQAQQQNLSEKQRVQDANTQMSNQELYRQAEAQRQNWLDRMNQAQAKAQAKTGQAQNLQGQAAQTGQMWQSIGSGVGAAAGAAANYAGKPAAKTAAIPTKDNENDYSIFQGSR